MSSFGMMNEAYFVGKNILIEWVNTFLDINIDKVETCANGAIYCNIWDALHPGSIQMKRVDFTVKQEFEFIKNWKLLQTAFLKCNIDKNIPVERLIKGRYQDNLEFLQWVYKYARDTYNGDVDDPEYDAKKARLKSKGGKDYNGSNKKGSFKNQRNRTKPNQSSTNHRSNTNFRPISAQNRNLNNKPKKSNMNVSSNHNNNNNNNNAALEALKKENQRLTDNSNAMMAKLSQLERDHNELSAVAKDIEKERDFYFNKVLSIENLCKAYEDQNLSLLTDIYNLLYQTDEEASMANNTESNDVPDSLNDSETVSNLLDENSSNINIT